VSSISKINLYDGSTLIGSSSSSSYTFIDGPMSSGNHSFTAQAVDSYGYTATSGAVSVSVASATVPGAPTSVSATAGNATATVSFSAPSSNGGAAITSYTATSSPGGLSASGAGSPLVVTGLTNGTAYTFTVTAANSVGTGPASAASNSVTPATVPTAPTSVSATAGNASATISFGAPASNGGAAITTYTATSSPGGLTASGAGSPLVVTSLSDGTAYTFTVTAANSAGTGPASAASNSVTPATVPTAPTSVSAFGGNAAATVSFGSPSSNGGAAITNYTATSSPGGLTASGAGSPLVVTGLTNGTAYTFTVTAANSAGTGPASAASNSVTPANLTVPGAPTTVSAEGGNASATVSFGPPGSNGGAAVTSYTATSNPGGLIASGPGSPLVVAGLTDGTAYTFTVTATNSVGTGPASAASNSVTPATTPSAPTSVSASGGNAVATVSFGPPGSNGGAAVTSYTATSNPGGLIASGPGSPLVVGGLTNGTAYTFTVTATNSAGTGPVSAASNSVTPATIPGAPTSVSAVGGNAAATVSFAAPGSDGGAAINVYTATSSPGGFTATGPASPVVIGGLADGTAYTFTVTATNSLGTGPASAASNSVTPVAPAPPQGTEQGQTPGDFSVASSGAATYKIPLTVPPGTAGMEPKLALSYNSQSGNGLLGVGWSLSGFSVIGRCAPTVAQDGGSANGSVNFSAGDRFCLDGERLMVVAGAYGASGSEYRTEVDVQSRIVSYGAAGSAPANSNPAYFVVQTKSGLTMEFGNTADSRVPAQGRSDGAVQVWALDKITDTAGNYMTITYNLDTANGEYYPARTDYTGNGSMAPNASVQFVYQSRTDVVPNYLAGSMTQNTVLLKAIQTYVGANQVLQYNIAYQTSSTTGRSTVTSIQECAMTPTVACKVPVTTNQIPASTAAFTKTSAASVGSWSTAIRDLVMDVNGDGKSDIVRLWQNGTLEYAAVWVSNGSGFTQVANQSVGTWCTCIQEYVMDINGDGKSDLVRLWQNGSQTYAAVWLSTGSGFTEVSNGPIGSWSTSFNYLVMDVNGDGRSDLVRLWQNGSLEYASVWLSTGTGFTQSSNASVGTWCTCIQDLVMDVNGDGKNDLVRLWQNGTQQYAAVWLSNGGGFSQVSNASIGTYSSAILQYPMDINGDGKTDLVRIWQNGTSAYASVWLSTGTGFTQVSNAAVGTWCSCIQDFYTADVNGDGKNDLVRLWQNGTQEYAAVWLSTGTGFKEVSNAAVGTYCSCITYNIMDVNGDGKTDLVSTWQNGSLEYATVWSAVGAGSTDLVASIVNSNGATTSISYQPLTNAAVYAKGTAAVYPVADVQQPIYVASSVQHSNGIGGVVTTSYQYGGLQTDFSGHGLLGFAWMQETSVDTNITTLTTNRQDWPYTGMPSQIKESLPGSGNGGVLKLTNNAYGCLNPANGVACAVGAGNHYFPYLSQSVESAWDLNGAALPVVTTNNSFDNYGELTQTSTGTSDSYCKATSNVYLPVTGSTWMVGRLARSTVSSKTPPDGATCP
jgi:hypothetical protein